MLSLADEEKNLKCMPEDVLLFFPNIIGYLRVLFMILSFYYAHHDWMMSFICYGIAFFGDVIDGFVARRFAQTSKFGSYLDMITDRVSTMGFVCVLIPLYPEYAFAFTMLIALDIASHWLHIMSVSGQQHKANDTLRGREGLVGDLLRWYYSVYPLFAYCCVGAEMFYLLLYVSHSDNYPDARIIGFSWLFCFPALMIKNIINVAQMVSAAYVIAEEDAYDRVQVARASRARRKNSKLKGSSSDTNSFTDTPRTSVRQRKQALRQEIPR